MASVRFEIEFDGIENDQIDGMEQKLLTVIEAASAQKHIPDATVTEISREEDAVGDLNEE